MGTLFYKGADQNRKEYLRAVKGSNGKTFYQKEYSNNTGPTKDDVVDSLMN